jgi:hypothetical protein
MAEVQVFLVQNRSYRRTRGVEPVCFCGGIGRYGPQQKHQIDTLL